VNNILSELIDEHRKDSSWQALSNNIAAANRFRLKGHATSRALSSKEQPKPKSGGKREKPDSPRITIDRRKLRKLCEGKTDIPLTFDEMELLDTYFTRNGGPGLAESPLFRRQDDLFEVLSNADRVSFFVGARFVELLDTEVIARRDVSALNVMRDRIGKDAATESFDVATRNTGRPLLQKEWRDLRSQATGNVLVSIASPIANASSEYLLAEMFDVQTYRARTIFPPVCFAQTNDNDGSPSAFVCEPDRVEGMKANEAALLIDEHPYISNHRDTEYGVVIGQRTGPNHAAFVIAGNSGPGTMAAAEFFTTGQISATLPSYANSDRQPILVAIISTDIGSAVTDRRIDKRTLTNTRMASRVLIFEYTGKNWEVVGG